MTRKGSLVLVAVLVLGSPALAAEVESKHSGQVVEVTPDGRTLVLEEMGPWTGPGQGLVTRSINLTPGTSVREIRPTGKWDANDPPGYDVRPLDLTAVKPGDFVTVTTERGPGSAAVMLDVMRPEGTEGLAAPRPESGR